MPVCIPYCGHVLMKDSWSLYLLFKRLSIIFHPMYISVVCFASWMIASHYKQSETTYKLLSPVTHLTVMQPMAQILDASPYFVPCACWQGCFSPLSSPGGVNGICYPAQVVLREDLKISLFSATLPPVITCLHLWVRQVGNHAGLGQQRK